MLRSLFLYAAIMSSSAVFAQKEAAPTDYAIILQLSPKYQEDSAWKAEDNAAVGAHFVALQKLQSEGRLTFAGRTTNKASMGIIILHGMTESEARAIMEGDKAVQRGIMRAELQPFQTVLKERQSK